MLHIYLARHGQDLDNVNGILNGHRDQPLSDLGKQQALELAEKIKSLDDSIKKSRHPELVSGSSFDKIYSSPLQRAYETGKITAEALGLPDPEKLDLLIERDFGVLTGRPHKDIDTLPEDTLVRTNTITYFVAPPEGESLEECLNRGKELLNFIQKKHTQGNILLFGHGDSGKMLYAAYYNLPWKDVLTSFHFGNGDLLLLSPDCTPEKSKVFEQLQHNL